MIGIIYINEDKVGEVNFEVTDRSMGAIGGDMLAYDSYSSYQAAIQKQCENKGIANIDDFNFRISIGNKFIIPDGGIGITDIPDFDPYVESAGNDLNRIGV